MISGRRTRTRAADRACRASGAKAETRCTPPRSARSHLSQVALADFLHEIVPLGVREYDNVCFSPITSHVESHHLHFRMRNRRAARLGKAFSKSLNHLRAATAMYFAHYNFVRRHSSIRTAQAVAAGLVDRPWTLAEFVEYGEVYGR